MAWGNTQQICAPLVFLQMFSPSNKTWRGGGALSLGNCGRASSLKNPGLENREGPGSSSESGKEWRMIAVVGNRSCFLMQSTVPAKKCPGCSRQVERNAWETMRELPKQKRIALLLASPKATKLVPDVGGHFYVLPVRNRLCSSSPV